MPGPVDLRFFPNLAAFNEMLPEPGRSVGTFPACSVNFGQVLAKHRAQLGPMLNTSCSEFGPHPKLSLTGLVDQIECQSWPSSATCCRIFGPNAAAVCGSRPATPKAPKKQADATDDDDISPSAPPSTSARWLRLERPCEAPKRIAPERRPSGARDAKSMCTDCTDIPGKSQSLSGCLARARPAQERILTRLAGGGRKS